MSSNQQHAQDLIDFIYDSPSPYHVINNAKELLRNNGFSELKLTDKWNIKKGDKHFVCQNDTSLFTFIVGKGEIEENGFKIVAAHSDPHSFPPFLL